MIKTPFVKGLIFVLIATLLASGLIFFNSIFCGEAFSSEEAQHGIYGLWIWRDIMTVDWNSFWYDTSRQLNWPFLHSWLSSLFFIAFGVSYGSARLLSLLLFMLSIYLVYNFSSTLSEKNGWKIGVLSSSLILTSPMMVKFASLNMLEGLGALIFLLSAYLYTICEEKKDLIHYILLTLLFGVALYTNYIYAYFIVVSFIVVTFSKLGPLFFEAYQISRQGEKVAMKFIWWAYRKLIVTGVFLLIIAAWFSFNFSRKFMLLVKNIFLVSGGVAVDSLWEGLTYYPKVIIMNLSFSPWIGLFLLASLLVPFIASRYRGLNRLYVYVWTSLLLATLTIPARLPQMIYIVVPFIFIIFSAVFFEVVEKIKAFGARQAKMISIVLLIPLIFSLPQLFSVYFPSCSNQNMSTVLDYYYTNIPKEAGISTILTLEHLNPDTVKFHFRDWRGDVLADPQLTEDELIGSGEHYYLTMDLDWESPYREEILDDSLFRWNSWIRQKEMDNEIRFYSSRRFEDIGVTAKIYKKAD